MPRLLESSHSFMLFDRRSPLPPLAVCPTPYYRLACPSRAIGTVFFASCSCQSLQCFKLEGEFYIKILKDVVAVVFLFDSSGCNRPITSSFRAEHLFSESLKLEDW